MGGETWTLGQLGTCRQRASSIDLQASTPTALPLQPPTAPATASASGRASSRARGSMGELLLRGAPPWPICEERAGDRAGAGSRDDRAPMVAEGGGMWLSPCVLPAMVLAAGLGTRLRPLTERLAKPLVPVGDRPALAHVLDRLRAAGAPRLVVNVHHHAAQLRAFATSHPDLAVSEETALLGTAGGVAHARALLGPGDALLWNADILADLDVRALVAAHRAAATLVVQPLAAGQGSVGLDGRGRVVRLRRERFADEVSGGEFLGIYVVSEALRARMPQPGGMVEDVLVPALARGEAVD